MKLEPDRYLDYHAGATKKRERGQDFLLLLAMGAPGVLIWLVALVHPAIIDPAPGDELGAAFCAALLALGIGGTVGGMMVVGRTRKTGIVWLFLAVFVVAFLLNIHGFLFALKNIIWAELS